MKRFTVPCDFSGKKYPFHVYVGEPNPSRHPLQHQQWWLSTVRGGTIPQEVMDSFERLHKIALENNVSFEDLCVYALGTAAAEGGQAVASDNNSPAAPAASGPVDFSTLVTSGAVQVSIDQSPPEVPPAPEVPPSS